MLKYALFFVIVSQILLNSEVNNPADFVSGIHYKAVTGPGQHSRPSQQESSTETGQYVRGHG